MPADEPPARGRPSDFSTADAVQFLRERRNWGRWGEDDQLGALNLIDDTKRREASKCVRSGEVHSLSRVVPKGRSRNNPVPALHYMTKGTRGRGGWVQDFYGLYYHGVASTHIDALCHIWDEEGMWNGRSAEDEIDFDGSRWGDISKWRDGIVTRGVLLDVPRHRGTEFVTDDRPVTERELYEICDRQAVEVEPGDAVVVYSGRDSWERTHGPYGGHDAGQVPNKPGLHASCVKFIRDNDCAAVIWDMMDAWPSDVDIPWPVHTVLSSFGVALIDNAYLESFAAACAAAKRHEFMLITAPLVMEGGTGSPVNPLAIL